MSVAACAFRVRVRDIRSRSRGKWRSAQARQAAIYLAHVAFRRDYASLARDFRRDRTTIRHACECIETQRDADAFDRMMHRLEAGSRALLASLDPDISFV